MARTRLDRIAKFSALWGVGFVLIAALPAAAQELVAGPYLQSATPTSMWISWETDSGEAATVEWGEHEPFVDATEGASHAGQDGSWHHEVHLENLSAGTRYSYRAVTGDFVGEVYHFRTPAAAEDEEMFRLVAMSDMQIDRGRPDQFREVVEEGVLAYVTAEYGPDLADELNMVLIPGDLVEDGSVYGQWAAEFFAPAAALFASVPVYPVAGNHERNSQYYFDYFHLPENGTPGFEEHWYFVDHGNVRVVGLDSNGLYRNPVQITWLEEVLEETCANDEIDFVFAQLHHPFHSELWPDGNTVFTGDVIEVLEQFSTDCEKPSVHFFGHTHGYSRGQSRDHRHLMVNVASAGGNLDYWDEYRQIDYDEYTVSQDEYGFVIVEVEAGDDPLFHLQRVSRGDADQVRENEVRDTVTIRRFNAPPAEPSRIGPLGDAVNPRCFTLALSPFDDDDGDPHTATHWQIAPTCDDFETPLIDRWRQSENWYLEMDSQAGDDLTDEIIEDLAPETDYCWRGRYRDAGLAWSPWSAPEPFHTSSASAMAYDLINPGAEDGTAGWVTEAGIFESLTEFECNGTSPFEGNRYFVVGGLCEASERATASQEIDLTPWLEDIRMGQLTVWFGAHARNWNGADRPELGISFANADGERLPGEVRVETMTDIWTAIRVQAAAPPEATTAIVSLHGTRFAGTDNDCYFDAITARMLFGEATCDGPPDPAPPAPPEEDAGAPPADAAPPDDGEGDAGTTPEADATDETMMADEEPEGCAAIGAAGEVGDLWPMGLVILLGLRRRRGVERA